MVSGAIYVFALDRPGTPLIQTIHPPNGTLLFGAALAVFEDDDDAWLIAGAPRSRHALVYHSSAPTVPWVHMRTLVGDSDSFGAAVAITPECAVVAEPERRYPCAGRAGYQTGSLAFFCGKTWEARARHQFACLSDDDPVLGVGITLAVSDHDDGHYDGRANDAGDGSFCVALGLPGRHHGQGAVIPCLQASWNASGAQLTLSEGAERRAPVDYPHQGYGSAFVPLGEMDLVADGEEHVVVSGCMTAGSLGASLGPSLVAVAVASAAPGRPRVVVYRAPHAGVLLPLGALVPPADAAFAPSRRFGASVAAAHDKGGLLAVGDPEAVERATGAAAGGVWVNIPRVTAFDPAGPVVTIPALDTRHLRETNPGRFEAVCPNCVAYARGYYLKRTGTHAREAMGEEATGALYYAAEPALVAPNATYRITADDPLLGTVAWPAEARASLTLAYADITLTIFSPYLIYGELLAAWDPDGSPNGDFEVCLTYQHRPIAATCQRVPAAERQTNISLSFDLAAHSMVAGAYEFRVRVRDTGTPAFRASYSDPAPLVVPTVSFYPAAGARVSLGYPAPFRLHWRPHSIPEAQRRAVVKLVNHPIGFERILLPPWTLPEESPATFHICADDTFPRPVAGHDYRLRVELVGHPQISEELPYALSVPSGFAASVAARRVLVGRRIATNFTYVDGLPLLADLSVVNERTGHATPLLAANRTQAYLWSVPTGCEPGHYHFVWCATEYPRFHASSPTFQVASAFASAWIALPATLGVFITISLVACIAISVRTCRQRRQYTAIYSVQAPG